MNTPIKILLIEDKDIHIAGAKEFFSNIEGIEITYAKTLVEAIAKYPKYIDGKKDYNSVNPINMKNLLQYDGVISDIHFPLRDDENAVFPTHGNRVINWTTPHPIGVGVAFMAHVMDVPYVLTTDDTHHGDANEWIYRVMTSLNEDSGLQYGHRLHAGTDDETGTKYWEYIWRNLKEQLIERGKLQ